MFSGVGPSAASVGVLAGNPLPILGTKSGRDSANERLGKVLRELEPGVPSSFFEFCDRHLLNAVSYYFVEMAIKDDDKASRQIMWEISKGMWEVAADTRQNVQRANDKLDEILARLKPARSEAEIEQDLRPRLAEQIRLQLERERDADPAGEARRLADIAITAIRSMDLTGESQRIKEVDLVLQQLHRQAAAHRAAANTHDEAATEAELKAAQWAFLVGRNSMAQTTVASLLERRPNHFEALILAHKLCSRRGDGNGMEYFADRMCRVSTSSPQKLCSVRFRVMSEVMSGRPAVAIQTATRALTDFGEEADSLMYAHLLHELAVAHMELAVEYERTDGFVGPGDSATARSEFAKAEKALLKAVTIAGQHGAIKLQQYCCTNLASVYSGCGQPDRALAYATHGLELAQSRDAPADELASAYARLATVYSDSGNLPAAETNIRMAIPLIEKCDDQPKLVVALYNLSSILARSGLTVARIAVLERVACLTDKAGGNMRLRVLRSLGLAYLDQGQLNDAERTFRSFLAASQVHGSMLDSTVAYEDLAWVSELKGDDSAAEDLYRHALELSSNSMLDHEARQTELLAKLLARQGRNEESAECMARAAQIRLAQPPRLPAVNGGATSPPSTCLAQPGDAPRIVETQSEE